MNLWRLLRTARFLSRRLMGGEADHDELQSYLHINHFTTRTLRALLTMSGLVRVRFHRIHNYAQQQGVVDSAKQFLFEVTKSRVNFSFPLVATAWKP